MRIAFDLDGTLIDSAPDIHAAVNRMLAEAGRPPLDLAKVITFVGNGLPHLVGLVIRETGLSMEQHKDLTARTLHHYSHPETHLTIAYDGVIAALTALHDQGHSLGICTNKPHAATLSELARLDLARCFSFVAGGDSYDTRKPDAAPLRHVLDALGTGPMLFVGDSEVDAQTARNAGVPFALFTRGYRRKPVDQLPHHMVFDDFARLPALVADMTAQA